MASNTLFTQLVSEWFPIVYERYDEPGTVYDNHCHTDKVSFYVIEWSVTFTFEDGSTKTISTGQRFDVPPKVYHTALVWNQGCKYIIGQILKDDA